jgi:hypothetical protein
MVLRRLASALRRQDWATVLIEFMIVVAGILVGLQIDDWNRQRVELREDENLLNEMYFETQGSIEYQQFFIDRINDWLNNSALVITAIEDRTLSAVSDGQVLFAIESLNYQPPLRPPIRVLELYDRQGGFKELDVPVIERAIAGYSGELQFARDALSMDVAVKPDLGLIARNALLPALDETETLGVRYSVDRSALLETEGLLLAMYEAYKLQKVEVENHRQDLLAATKRTCDKIASWLERPGCSGSEKDD